MLSAKTNTTCREKDTSRRNDFNADGPTAHFTASCRSQDLVSSHGSFISMLH